EFFPLFLHDALPILKLSFFAPHRVLAPRRIARFMHGRRFQARITGNSFGISVVPIYAYKCSACGHAQDVLQKMSDPILTVCPECGQNTYAKQVTAAGFQLKGSGWYVTDFRNNGSSAPSRDR